MGKIKKIPVEMAAVYRLKPQAAAEALDVSGDDIRYYRVACRAEAV